MTWYALHRADGSLASEGTSIAATLPDGWVAREYPRGKPSGMAWNPHTLDYDVPLPTPAATLTRLEFLRRFTVHERIGVRAAIRAGDAVVDDFMSMLEMADEVDLGNADVTSGLRYLEAHGLLAAGRAAEIGG